MAHAKIVAIAMLVGACGSDIRVASDDSPECPSSNPGCTSSQLELAPPQRISLAENTLPAATPRWTITGPDVSAAAVAPNGGLWLFAPDGESARRIDANGETLRSVALPIPVLPPSPSARARLLRYVFKPSAHALGPIAITGRNWVCEENGSACPGTREVRQVVVIPEDANAAPFVVPCSSKDARCNLPSGAARGEDGQTVMLNDASWTRLFTLDGQLRWEQPLYGGGLWGYSSFQPLAHDRWIMFGRYSQTLSPALLTVGEGRFDQLWLEGATPRTPGPQGEVLRGDRAGEYVLALQRSTSYEALGGPNDVTLTSVAGDLSVLHMRGGEVLDEHLLSRVDLPLALDAAAIDSAGNVYLATASATRDRLTHTITTTPLLCRFVPRGEASCFALPVRAAQLHGGGPNTVFALALATSTLARYDWPL
jgi:hypothetical protein